MKWTQQEIDLLTKEYSLKSDKELLLLFPNRTYPQIKDMASKRLKIKKLRNSKAIWNLEKLDSFDEISCYWWGMLMADGCFTERQLILSLQEKDKDHLNKFASYCNSNVTYVERINDYNPIIPQKMYRTAISSIHYLSKWNSKFSMTGNKTKNPPDISFFLTYERILPFIAGLIDGDGYISVKKSYVIEIKAHGNWKDNFQQISDYLLKINITSYIKTNNLGFITLMISKKQNIKNLYLKINHLPILNRKWDKIQNL